MKLHLRTAGLVLLVYGTVVPAIYVIVSLPIGVVRAYGDWLNVLEACKRAGTTPPDIDWFQRFISFELSAAALSMVWVFCLVRGVVPSLWALARGALPIAVVVASPFASKLWLELPLALARFDVPIAFALLPELNLRTLVYVLLLIIVDLCGLLLLRWFGLSAR